MKCEFCGREIPADHVQKSCGLCAGGCRKVHCPYCGHENPATPAYLRRFAEKEKKNENGEDRNQ
ncbi:MAG: hypothetical protein A2X84_13450 [Desulfuromonadaceae bacterium GWC2_58_13]|nr:MAG: hypothetical protein A2X84_13450 [Desulfuromonadaceae bacterium GWC2_58_13]